MSSTSNSSNIEDAAAHDNSSGNNVVAQKTSTTTVEGSSGDDGTKTPHYLYFDRMKAFKKEHNLTGQMLVRGIARSEEDNEDYDEDEEEDTEEEGDNSKYTMEQMESLRFILLTDNRRNLLEEYHHIILGDQADGGIMMFNTSFSYEIMDSWAACKQRLTRKSPSQKLDILIAYTHTIMEWDVWMHDNEGDMDVVVKGLATSWRNLIKKNDDAALGWDQEYTKPGVMEMLSQFKKKVESMGEDYGYDLGKFKYM